MEKSNPVIHFEMPSKDSARIAKFYKEAFGWDTKELGKAYGDYVLALTTDIDERGMPTEPGTINGGFFPVKENMPAQTTLVVIRVADMNKAVRALGHAGGTLNVKPMEIPDIGMYASFYDTEGNHVGLLELTLAMKEKVNRQPLVSHKDNP